jgi:hypothetical protein
MEFVKYQHIERLGTDEVDGILNGYCHLFCKIDGTNGQVYLNDASDIEVGSRNRVLSDENDNAGFYQSVKSNANLCMFIRSHPHLKLFGEWLVPHTLRTYREDAWRKFYVFDVMQLTTDNEWRYLTYAEYEPLLAAHGVDYVPVMMVVKNPTEEFLVSQLQKTGDFLIEDGKGLGEGIVVKNYDYRNKYGRQTWAKIVRSEFKEKHTKNFGAPYVEIKESVEDAIVNKYVTKALVEKEKAKIETACDGWKSPYIPRLLETVFHCLVVEDAYNFVKEFKSPVIDFRVLRSKCEKKTKELMPTVF